MRKKKIYDDDIHDDIDDDPIEVIDLRDHVLSAASAFGYLRNIAYMDISPHRAKDLMLAASSQVEAARV